MAETIPFRAKAAELRTAINPHLACWERVSTKFDMLARTRPQTAAALAQTVEQMIDRIAATNIADV